LDEKFAEKVKGAAEIFDDVFEVAVRMVVCQVKPSQFSILHFLPTRQSTKINK
jgi:hypothetical protein